MVNEMITYDKNQWDWLDKLKEYREELDKLQPAETENRLINFYQELMLMSG